MMNRNIEYYAKKYNILDEEICKKTIQELEQFQTGNSDTLTCYSNVELKKIATRVVQASEADTLLKLYDKELRIASGIILNQEQQIISLDTLIQHQESVMAGYDSIILVQSKNIDALHSYSVKLQKDKVKLKSAWYSSTVLMIVITLLVAI